MYEIIVGSEPKRLKTAAISSHNLLSEDFEEFSPSNESPKNG